MQKFRLSYDPLCHVLTLFSKSPNSRITGKDSALQIYLKPPVGSASVHSRAVVLLLLLLLLLLIYCLLFAPTVCAFLVHVLYVVFCVNSSFAIISLRPRELVVLL